MAISRPVQTCQLLAKHARGRIIKISLMMKYAATTRDLQRRPALRPRFAGRTPPFHTVEVG
jgi:hypothetical protein